MHHPNQNPAVSGIKQVVLQTSVCTPTQDLKAWERGKQGTAITVSPPELLAQAKRQMIYTIYRW